MSQRVSAVTRAVVFDAVGTLIFPEPSAARVYADLARRAGCQLSDDTIRARFLAAYRAEEEADRAGGWVTSEVREHDRWRRIVTATLCDVPDPDACFRALFDHFSRPTAWRVNPAAPAVFAGLRRRGLVLGMGTNYDARVWQVIDGFPDLAPVRERVVVSAAVGHRKPAAGFFREVVRAVGCEPHEVLFVGDDLDNDYRGPLAAGLTAVLYDPRGEATSIPNRIRTLEELVTSGSRASPP